MSDHIDLDKAAKPEPRIRLAEARQGQPSAKPAAEPARTDGTALPSEFHLRDFVKVVYKRRWTAAAAFLLVFVSVTVYTFTVTPMFEAKTRLLIEADDQNVVNFKQVIEEDRQQKADYYATQYNILQSRALARKTIEALRLWDSPHFGAAPKEKGFSVAGTLSDAGAWVKGLFQSASGAAPVEPAADETFAQSKAIDAFLLHLNVSPIRNSRIVDLKFRMADPTLSSQIANQMAKSYIEQNLEYKFMASKEASDWLGERLADQRKQVEAAETKLQQYRERNDAISLQDRENIVVQKLGDLNAAVTRAKTDRIQREAMYNQLKASEANPSALDTFPAILSNTFIQQQKGQLAEMLRQQSQLSEKLGDKHPQLITLKSTIETAEAKLRTEVAKVVQSVKSEYQAALSQEQSLSAALNQQKSEALAMNRKGIEYSVLDRDVQSNKQIYESLLQRAKETGVSGELKASNIRVVDPAERPRYAVTPYKTLNLALAMVGGGIFALGLAFFFEYFDSRIKSPDELTAHLGLAALGMVPALAPKSWEGSEPLISHGVPANFGESIRSVRTNVLFSSAQEGSRSLVVTSSGPGEGKTLVASNLAVALAQTGQRVLIIDADMRRPRVHEVFGMTMEPGLSNVLVSNAKASEAVRKTDVAGLWVMTSGHIPPNPAELLGSERFRGFLQSLGQHFDWVLIDTPPVLAVTDSAVVANVACGVVFVVGAEMTSRHNARHAVEQLHRGQAKFVGAVLNRVELERNAYYYSQYYRKEYAAYYQQAAGGQR